MQSARIYAVWDRALSFVHAIRACIEWVLSHNASRFGIASRASRDDARETRAHKARVVRVVAFGGAMARDAACVVARALDSCVDANRLEVVDAPSRVVTAAIAAPEAHDDQGVAYAIVVETAEGDEPAMEAREVVREVLRAAASASAGTGASTPTYALVAIGDTNIIPDRSAFRSNQNVSADCNAVGHTIDNALRLRLGWRRVGRRMDVDAAKLSEDWASADDAPAEITRWARDVVHALAT